MRHEKPTMMQVMALVAMLVLGATGCSGGGQGMSDTLRAQQAKDSKALEDLYEGVQGHWEGVVANPAIGLEPFRAEFNLYTYYVSDGTNPDGSARVRPALRGRFRPVDFVSETDLITLSGDFDRNGRLIMTGQIASGASGTTSGGASGASGADVKILSLRGTVLGGKMNIEVTREGGVWGFLEATRTSTDASAPVAGEAAEYRERFLRVYGPFEGTYVGQLKAANGNNYGVQIAVVIIERPLASGGSRPMLMALYRRLDIPVGAGIEWSLDVDYNLQTGDIVMRESSLNPPSTIPGAWVMSISGKLGVVNGKKTMKVTIRNKTSTLGDVVAIRK